MAGVESDKSRGLYVDPAAGRVTLREYAQSWQASQVHRRRTAANFDSHLRNHILPTLGDRPLAAVTRLEVQAWVKSRTLVLAPTTTRTVYAVVRMIFRAAVADRLIAVSPCERIALPRLPRRDELPLSRDSVLALVEASPDHYRAIIVVTAGTGLRQGEVFGLAPDRVDFLRRQLVVDAQLVLLPGAPPYVAPPKTAASYRTVPLADVVLEAVAAHMKTFPATTASDETGKERPLVFSDRKGRPLSRTHFHQYGWAPAVRAAGLPVGTQFHELRH